MILRTGDAVVIVIYFIALIVVGLWFARRNKSTEDYFLGNRSFPGWAIGISLVGTSISSISFLAYPADAYKTAYLRLLGAFTLPIAILAASMFFLQFYRRSKVTTAFEYLEGRFGPVTRVYGASMFIIMQVVRVSIILYLISTLIQELTGFSPIACVIVGGAIVSFYTIVGGIEAVIWTDVAQTIVLVFGGVLSLGIIVYQLDGGFGEIFTVASEAGKFRFAEYISTGPDAGTLTNAKWNLSITEKTATMMIFVGLTNWLTEYSCNQNVVQRYCASSSAKEAKKAMWICCLTSIPIWVFFMFLGTAMYVFYQANPTDLSQAILEPDGPAADKIYPHFMLNQLPVGVAGLVIAAALAAAMSSLDSSINAISTVGIVDLYRRHLVKDREDKHYLFAARTIAMVVAVIMIGGAIILTNAETKTLQDTATRLQSITISGLLGLYMLGFFTRRGDDRAMLTGIGFTILFTAYMGFKDLGGFPDALRIHWLDDIDGYYTATLGNVLMFTLGYFGSRIIPNRGRDLTNLTVYTQDDAPLE